MRRVSCWMRSLLPALVPALVLASAAGSGAAEPGDPPGIGSRLRNLELSDLKGTIHRVEWGPTGPTAAIVFFFEERCAECLREMSFVDGLLMRGRDFGLEAYAVEATGLVASRAEESLGRYKDIYGEPSFPVVADPGRSLGALLGVQRLPTTLLVQRHGVVLARMESFRDRDAVELVGKTERLLGLAGGFFSPALREIEIDAGAERELRAALASPAAAGRSRPAGREPLAVGESVPPFEFTDLAGAGRRWEPAPGKPGLTVVFFWGALCQPCIQEMAYLDEIFAVARDEGLQVIAVEGSGLEAARTALVIERYRRFRPAPAYHVVPDPEFRLARLFRANGSLPLTFLIDGSGEIVYRADQFVEGHETGLGRRLEMAMGLEPGSLARRVALSRGETGPAPVEAEAPSVVADIDRRGEYQTHRIEGDTYYDSWMFERALPHYLLCLELEPRDVDVRARVARIYQRKGGLGLALAHWLALLEIDPGHAEARTRVEALRGQGVEPVTPR